MIKQRRILKYFTQSYASKALKQTGNITVATKEKESLEDMKFSNKSHLVIRPPKGFMWGLGNEVSHKTAGNQINFRIRG